MAGRARFRSRVGRLLALLCLVFVVGWASPHTQENVGVRSVDEQRQVARLARLAHARLALEQGDPADALETIRALGRVSDRTPEMLSVEARALYALGRSADATLILRVLLARHPGRGEDRALLARCHRQLGKLTAARNHWEYLARADEHAYEAQWELARLERCCGRFREAEQRLLPLLRSQTYGTKAAVEYAIIMAQRGRFTRARDLLVNLCRRGGGETAQIAYNLGLIYIKLGALPEARSALRQAATVSPNFPAAWNNLAIVCERLSATKEAEVAYRRALELVPADVGIALNLIRCQLARGELQPALQLLGRISDFVEDQDRATWLSVRGLALGLTGRDVEASQSLEHSIRLRPNHGSTLYNLAACYFNCGKFGKTLRCIELADKAGYDTTALRVKLEQCEEGGPVDVGCIEGRALKHRETVEKAGD